MKTKSIAQIAMVLFGSLVVFSCKNPNATQETDGREQDKLTTTQIDSSSIERPGDTIPSNVPKDLEGSNTSNN